MPFSLFILSMLLLDTFGGIFDTHHVVLILGVLLGRVMYLKNFLGLIDPFFRLCSHFVVYLLVTGRAQAFSMMRLVFVSTLSRLLLVAVNKITGIAHEL